jgi:hypothetical protein
MPGPQLSDAEFVRVFESEGAAGIVRLTGQLERGVYARRRDIEKRVGRLLTVPSKTAIKYPGRVNMELHNGTALIGSDFHIWPGEESTCLRAFKKFTEDIRPDIVILNGDVMDFPRISRHPQNWETAPDPQEEIEAAQDHLQDIVSRCKRGAKKYWTLGNHDARFELMLAGAAPQYRRVKGVHLSDHFGAWEKAMSVFLNEEIEGGQTMVKHIPPGGGVNATRNFVVKAGIHVVHGHNHRQGVCRVSNYRRHDFYGVDGGMVADKEHKAFGYAQDNPLDWGQGFCLLTYLDGVLMPPELITKVDDGTVYFRGQLHGVGHANKTKEASKTKAKAVHDRR